MTELKCLCKLETWNSDGKKIYRAIIESTGVYCICDDRGLFQTIDNMINYLQKLKNELKGK